MIPDNWLVNYAFAALDGKFIADARIGTAMKEWFDLFANHPYVRELIASTVMGLGVYCVCALIIVGAEIAHGRDPAVYRTPNARNDLAYAVFYKCSIYSVLVYPLFCFVTPRLQFLQTHALSGVSPTVSLIVCWVIYDFLHYWTHRMQHAIRPLWAFHSVHHAQTQLTFLSANRIHAFEQLWVGVLMLVPAFLLGVPQPRWLPLLLVQLFTETIQHARLDWSYGPLQRVFVSPATHAIHHSIDEREHNANYAIVLSLWDILFGTFSYSENASRRYGVRGMEIPESLMAQFFHPFRFLASRRRVSRSSSAEPALL